MSEGKIKAIIKRPDERYGHVTNISPTLKNLQNTVDGPIQAVRVGDSVILCNEEGKFRDLPFNFYIGDDDCIVGTVAVVGSAGDEFGDCPLSFSEWKRMLIQWGN